ncbi:hypothetical protein BCR41DRAFT_318866 [Lobosporangium transversale]|uniref:DUF6589 domain-containing protein n=1 Tax=Lobosporangium transversale TaxID=64571 RepID=A0A1Y2GWY9_9FUNG|nr:hypothetical protein BCR41DRAFT_318866 [Lobosporangium transversale]ORZ26785.1 hypothetical protein BCR41DRAFT_318866 [Lobosporangium transversale]|eukprot:XP_021884548.1 hypothetical protein BCR41DRAFT_318866 [Lobosporangium transversale]
MRQMWKALEEGETPTPTSEQQEELEIIDETPSIYPSNDDYLVDIFKVLVEEKKISLRQFLSDVFESRHRVVQESVKRFYANSGPAFIVETWKSQLESEKAHNKAYDDLGRAAADIVVDGAKRELEELTKTDDLRLPAKNLSPKVVQEFSLNLINKKLESAPLLFKIISNLTSVNPYSIEKAPAIRVTIVSMLVKLCSQKSSYLQMMMGLHLHASGCPKRVINLLAVSGLSVSHMTICTALRSLTRNSLQEVRSQVRKRPWYLLYDNIDMASRKYDQRSNNLDSFDNGTTATIVLGEDIGPDQDQDVLLISICTLIPRQLHSRDVTRFHLVDVLQRHFTTYGCSMDAPSIEPLEVKETKTYPLPALKIDQSTISGNIEILETIMGDTLQLPEEWFTDYTKVIVAGDQLTISRIASLQELRREDRTSFDRMQWAIPVIQLFHLQIVLCGTILRTHYGSFSSPGSLGFIISMLGRKRLGRDTSNFHVADELIRHTFDAMVRRLWEVEFGLNISDMQAYECRLENYGKSDNILGKVCEGVDAVIQKWLRNAHQIAEESGSANANAALFIRDALVYIELGAAIKAGDIGRIQDVLGTITVMFQAGGMKNYAGELLRLTYGIHYGWSAQRRKAILSSLLINTKGKENGWIPADLYQEHNNLLTKVIHTAKGSNMSWETLANSISTNIRLFSKLKSVLESQYNMIPNSTRHSPVSVDEDIIRIVAHLRDYNILGRGSCLGSSHIPITIDLYCEGFEKLVAGRFQNIVKHISERNSTEDMATVLASLAIEDQQVESYIISSTTSTVSFCNLLLSVSYCNLLS